jgi:hypothetical protein
MPALQLDTIISHQMQLDDTARLLLDLRRECCGLTWLLGCGSQIADGDGREGEGR